MDAKFTEELRHDLHGWTLGMWTITTSDSGFTIGILRSTRKWFAIVTVAGLFLGGLLLLAVLLPLLSKSIGQRIDLILGPGGVWSLIGGLSYQCSWWVAIAVAGWSMFGLGFLFILPELEFDNKRSLIIRRLLWGIWRTEIPATEINEIQLRVEVDDRWSLDSPKCRLQLCYGRASRSLSFGGAFSTFSPEAIVIVALIQWMSAVFHVPVRLVYAPLLRGRQLTGGEDFLARLSTLELREPKYLS